MEQGLRDCCRSIRIGKILIQSDEETQKAKVYYAKFPPDVYRRKVLLMYPILSESRFVLWWLQFAALSNTWLSRDVLSSWEGKSVTYFALHHPGSHIITGRSHCSNNYCFYEGNYTQHGWEIATKLMNSMSDQQKWYLNSPGLLMSRSSIFMLF